MRIYAIGDIHGHLEKLQRAHALIAADRERTGDTTAEVIHLGDLVDRGPDARGVVEHLCRGVAAGEPWQVLKGNHDRMCAFFLRDPSMEDPALGGRLEWLDPRLGGAATLASYGVRTKWRRRAAIAADARARVPVEHREFLESRPLTLLRGPLLFVHAGIRPEVPLAEQAEDDLVWIRDGFLDYPEDFGWLVVHGHTWLDAPTHFGNRVDLDGGAAFGNPLVPAVFEDEAAFTLTDTGRVPLRAPV